MEWKPDRIKLLRKSLGLTQNKFAKRLGVSKRSVIRWENGTSAPTVAVRLQLERIAEEVTDLEGDISEGDTFEGDSNNPGNNPKSGNNSNEKESVNSSFKVNSTGDPVQAYYETMYSDARGVISLCTITQTVPHTTANRAKRNEVL